MSAETLIRTGPNSVNYAAVSGGIAELTAEEIAAMLHNTHDGEFYLVMTKYAGQDHTKIVAYYLYKHHLAELYHHYKMDANERGRGKLNRESGFLWQLIYLAVNEYIDPCRCLVCHGTGYTGDGIKHRITLCKTCCGSSHIKLKDDQKGRYLKTARFDYWRPLYEQIYTLLNQWDCNALRELYYNENG